MSNQILHRNNLYIINTYIINIPYPTRIKPNLRIFIGFLSIDHDTEAPNTENVLRIFKVYLILVNKKCSLL